MITNTIGPFFWAIVVALLLPFAIPTPCSLENCDGTSLISAIKRDFEPWRLRGGIKRKDVDEAQSWRVHRNQFTRSTNDGWLRITIHNNQLYASHLGAGFGSRDGVYLLVLIELLKKHRIADVDFVLSVMDRAHVEKARWPWRDMLPFLLSFANSPDHLDVAIPDPSFWAWPEKAIRSQWELLKDSAFVWPWDKKAPLVHWRGGLARSGGLRKKLAACANESPKCTSMLDIRAAGPNSELWEPPMGMCRFKAAVFAQGEGYTSSKHRTLGCGSLPVFLEYINHDTYYGRFLKPDVHYKRLRYSLRPNATDQDDAGSCICGDLDRLAGWLQTHDKEAATIGAAARQFAERVLGQPMVEAYLLAVLRETHDLQQMAAYDVAAVVKEVHGEDPQQQQGGGGSGRGVPIQSPAEVQKRFAIADDAFNRTEVWARREGALNAAIASMEGRPCPKDACAKCCGHPSTRANPTKLIRSPCPPKPPHQRAPEMATCEKPLDSRDPWRREGMLSVAASAMMDREMALTRAAAGASHSGGGDFGDGSGGGSSANSGGSGHGKEPPWKKWQAKQRVGDSEPLSSDLLPLEEEDPMRGGAGSHFKGWCKYCKPGKGGRPLLAVADPHSKDKSLSKAEMAAMQEALAATAEKHEKHLAWAARYGKPHPLSKAEVRSFHRTKRDPSAPSGGIGRQGGAMLAGASVNQLLAQRTGSDPLDGHRRYREEHD